MKIEEVFPYIEPEDIPENYSEIISLIGLETFLKLCQHYAGDEIYFPKIDRVIRKARDRMIRKEYNGFNVRMLAQKYGLSIKQIYNILKGSNSP